MVDLTDRQRKPFQVRAQNLEDIVVASSRLQDALAPVSDMVFEASKNRFVLVVNRFKWESGPLSTDALTLDDGFGTDETDELPADTPAYLRVNCGLRIHNVSKVRRRSINLDDRGTILNLLAIRTDANAVILEFSGGACLELTVDQVDMLIEDIGEPWLTYRRPAHSDEEDQAAPAADETIDG